MSTYAPSISNALTETISNGTVSSIDYIVIIAMENEDYSSVLGSAQGVAFARSSTACSSRHRPFQSVRAGIPSVRYPNRQSTCNTIGRIRPPAWSRSARAGHNVSTQRTFKNIHRETSGILPSTDCRRGKPNEADFRYLEADETKFLTRFQ